MGQNTSKSPLAASLLIEYDELLELINEINQKCFETAGNKPNDKYLCFAIKKGSTETFLWKATIRICCFTKMLSDTNTKAVSGRTFTLRQFLRLYQAIKPLIEAVHEGPNLNQIFECNDLMSTSMFQDSCTNEGECVICLEREPDTVLPCSHAYCSKCLDDCRRHNQKCPLCRVGSTFEEDEWVVPKMPEADDLKNYVSSLSKPSFSQSCASD
uniref:RING-type domain-containing protein n=1 Tax=Panagrolaimus sp. PS1159 TaxID=55785 RepID=A0AC35G5F6_9BILA